MLKLGTSRKGRKCKYRGCKHILSIYNHDTHCHLHSDHKAEAKVSTKKASK